MKTPDEFDGSGAWEPQTRGTWDTSQSDTCIALYLRDVGQVKRLTRNEEMELAVRIKQGDAEARDEMIKANLPLVIKIAKSYQGIGLPLLDLISEGNIGLMRAVERFDPSKGAKLSCYGALWITQAITKALSSQSRTMQLPTYLVDKLRKMSRAASRLEEELGRAPTDEELAAEVGTTSGRVTQMRMSAVRPASLDAQIDGDDSGSYAETISDEKAESPHDKLDRKAGAVMMREIVQTLDQRERVILRLRFGLDGESPKTLDEIGQELGVSSERVRQLQKAALKKVRCRMNNLEYRSLSPKKLKSGNNCKLRL